MNKLFLGMDIGASKTDVILADESGSTLYKFKTKGINIHNQSPKEIDNILTDLGDKLKNQTNKRQILEIHSACLGVTSFDSDEDKKVWRRLVKKAFQTQKISISQIRLVSDVFISLKSGTYRQPAMCLIVGTGVNCYGLDNKGQEFKAGDWGYLVGDQGSGYWLGRRLLQIAIKELDHRLPKTLVSELILSQTKSQNLLQLIDWTYQHQNVRDIAQLTQVFANPVLTNLPSVQTLLHQAMEELLISLSAVYGQCQSSTSISLICTGGMFANQPFKSVFTHELHTTLPQLEPIFPQERPVVTALNLAMGQTDIQYPKSSVAFTISVTA